MKYSFYLYLLFLIPLPVFAQWNQNASTGPFVYTNTGNWVGSTINGTFSTNPTTGLQVDFSGNYTTTSDITFSYSNGANITFDSDTGGVSRTITLGGDIRSSATGGSTVTLGSDLIFDVNGTRIFDAPNSGNSLVINSQITGTGTVQFDSGTGSIELNNSANDFRGDIFVGFVRSLKFNSIGNVGGGASALGAPTTALEGKIKFNNSTSFTEFEYTGSANSSTDRIFELRNTLGDVVLKNSGTGKLTITSDVEHFNDNDRPINFKPTTGEIEWSGVLGDPSTQSLSILQNASGTTTLSGNNTYSGTTSIQNGTLIAGNNNALGSTTGGTSITNAASLQLNGVNIGAEALTLSSIGSASTGGLFSNSGSANTYAGNITLGNTGKIRVDTNSTTLTVSGQVSLAGNQLQLEADATSDGGSTLEVSGQITGSGSLNVVSGQGNVILSNDTNNFDGPITVGFVRNFDFSSIANINGGASALGTPTSSVNGTITVSNGGSFTRLQHTGNSASTTDRIFSLNGTGEAAIRTSGTGKLTISSNLAHTSDNSRTLTLDTTNGEMEWTGNIINPSTQTLTLKKSGSNTLTLSGNNTYSGGLTASGGTLILNSNNALGGTAGNGALTIGGSSLEIASGVTIANGTLTLSSNNTAIRGLGTLQRNVTIDDTGNAFSSIQAGTNTTPIGTLGLGNGGTSTFQTGGSYVWNMNDFTGAYGTGYSALEFSGTLNIQATALNPFNISINGYNGSSLGTPANFTWGNTYNFEIVRATSITNFNADFFRLDASSLFGDHWRWSIYESGNSLWLRYDAVPEPGTWFAGVSLVGTFFLIRLRKKRKSKSQE